jgi:hypothetical protein
MSRRLRIPFLLDLVTVDEPEDAAEMNVHPHVTRTFTWDGAQQGPLINRERQHRVLDVMEADGRLLPVFTGREDSERAKSQRELTRRLSDLADGGGWTAEDIGELSGYVRGDRNTDRAGVVVQRLLGRLFDPSYTASLESYRAARLIGDWMQVGMLRAWWWVASGKLGAAREEVWKRANYDPHCIHATAIAVHNIVDSLARMAALRNDPSRRERLSDETILGQCIKAPPRLLRRSVDKVDVAFLRKPIPKHALVVFDLQAMHEGSTDTGLAFLEGEWSQCPAHRFVPALLLAVWRAATSDDKASGG